MAPQWHKVTNVDLLCDGEMQGHEVAGHPVLLINLDGEVLAYRDRCPHQGWPLHRGVLEEEALTCANHLWVFNVSTGQGVNTPVDCFMVRYPCTVDEDGTILVSLE